MSQSGKGQRLCERQVVESVGITISELRVWCEAGWVAPAARLHAAGGRSGGAGAMDAQAAAGDEGGQVFDDVDVARVRLVCQLRDDLGLDAEAIPVVLSLVDQLYGVRRELRAMVRAVEQQDRAVAERIREAYRTLADDR